MRIRLPIVSLLLLILSASSASAHGFQLSFEKQVGTSLVDVGYDVFAFETGRSVNFDFALILNAGKPNAELAPYDEVWVQISGAQEGQEPFRKTLTLDAPVPASLTYEFESEGEYELAVRFLQDGKSLADASFPIPVTAPGLPIDTIFYTFIGLINVAFFVAIAISWWRSKRK